MNGISRRAASKQAASSERASKQQASKQRASSKQLAYNTQLAAGRQGVKQILVTDFPPPGYGERGGRFGYSNSQGKNEVAERCSLGCCRVNKGKAEDRFFLHIRDCHLTEKSEFLRSAIFFLRFFENNSRDSLGGMSQKSSG